VFAETAVEVHARRLRLDDVFKPHIANATASWAGGFIGHRWSPLQLRSARLAPGRRWAYKQLDLPHHVVGEHRFRDHLIETRFEQLDAFLVQRMRREGHDARFCERRILPQLQHRLRAGHPDHADVHQDLVRLLITGNPKRVGTAGGGHRAVTGEREIFTEDFEGIFKSPTIRISGESRGRAVKLVEST
jgi:hypothetical protein